jgi:hypothetical protein
MARFSTLITVGVILIVTGMPISSSAQCTLPDNAVGWWPLDCCNSLAEGTNDMVHITDAILEDPPLFTALPIDGKVGCAYDFGHWLGGPEGDAWISVPNRSELNLDPAGFTLMAWVYVHNTPSSPLLMKGSGYEWKISSGKHWLSLCATGSPCFVLNGTVTVPINTWVFVAAVVRTNGPNTEADFYVDCSMETVPWPAVLPDLAGSGSDLWMGYDGGSVYLSGLMDEVAIFDRALLQSEVNCICNAGADGMFKTDCNNNGILDDFDIDPSDPDGNGQVSNDCNDNGIPDECEAIIDCNNNGIHDDCDVDPSDPDGNGVVSNDCNGNGIPDECEAGSDGQSYQLRIFENHSDAGCWPCTTPIILREWDFDSTPCDEELWTAVDLSGRGLFADLYTGSSVLQADPCFTTTCMWGFFDTSLLPPPGVVPFVDAGGLYMNNEVWSPAISLAGASEDRIVLEFDVYRDAPLDNLVFYTWRIRSKVLGVWGEWKDRRMAYYGFNDEPDWVRHQHDIGDLIETGATDIQVALGVRDFHGAWCSSWGTGDEHTQGPLFDNVTVSLFPISGPQFGVRAVDLFQDNFAGDGTLTGTVRADAALDIMPRFINTIVPGDSIVISVGDKSYPIAVEPTLGIGPAIYCYVALWPQNQIGKTGPGLEAPETRSGVGLRYPFLANITIDAATWFIYRMDTVVVDGSVVPGLYCFDLNDDVLTPGDTLCYFFAAENTNPSPQRNYWSETTGTSNSYNVITNCSYLMEFTCLPAGGPERGGDILFVDDFDGRGGQPYFDTSFEMLELDGLVDRYDVRSPSSMAGNGPGSRVTDVTQQLISSYRKIIWYTCDLPVGLVGTGMTNPEKSPDFCMLHSFADDHTDRPGIYFTGDNIAEEWMRLMGAGCTIAMFNNFMHFDLVSGNHRLLGEPVSTCLVGSNCFGFPFPDSLVAVGGCPNLNNFDVLGATGSSVVEISNPVSGYAYSLSQSSVNSEFEIAKVILEGFGFCFIRECDVQSIPARVWHLKHALECLENIIAEPVGVDPVPVLKNFLDDSYPNPFNPAATIRYGIEQPAHVSLRIYNVSGQLVRTLVDEMQTPAPEGFVVRWDGTNNDGTSVSSGVYFCRLLAGKFMQTRKMVLLK